MQVLAISTPRTEDEARLLSAQHALRAKIFADRLGWNVDVDDGMEIDRFDALHPTYILAVGIPVVSMAAHGFYPRRGRQWSKRFSRHFFQMAGYMRMPP